MQIPVVTTVPVAPPASGNVGGAIDPGAGVTDSDQATDAGAAADEGASGAEGAAGGAGAVGGTAGEADAGTTDEGAGLGFTTESTPAPAAEDQAPAAAQDTESAVTDEQGIEDYFNVASIGGVLAAGLLTLLGFRRLAQRRNRKPRQRIAMPDETLATVELELVKGQPISGVPDKRYVFADRLRNEMIATIGDVAHEVARRNLTAGKVRGARMASAIGRMVDPVNEIFWRDGLRAEHQAGDVAGGLIVAVNAATTS